MPPATFTTVLAPAQQRLWFLDQLDPGNPLYNIALAFDLEGRLDIPALEHTLNVIRQRHSALRAVFPALSGLPSREVRPPRDMALTLEDISGLPPAARDFEVARCTEAERHRGFDLAAGPLNRALLLRLDSQHHVLIVVAHQIVFDAWSTDVFLRELATLYASRTRGGLTEPVEPLQHADVVRRRHDWLDSDAFAADLAYWKEHLRSPRPLLALPTDHPRPPELGYFGHRAELTLSPALVSDLDHFSRLRHSTFETTLLAAYATFLYRYTGQDDLLVGLPVANRTDAERESVIGLLANTLALRFDVSGEPSFAILLERARQVIQNGLAHQSLPFETLIEALNPDRSLSHAPLLQAIMAVSTVGAAPVQAGDLTVRRRVVDRGTSEFDLTLAITQSDKEWNAALELNADLFEPATGTRMVRQFVQLLESIVENPEIPVGQLPLLPDDERRLVVEEWNRTARPYPLDKTLVTLFEEQVARTPGSVALVCAGEQLTYEDLNREANRCANRLRSMGVAPDDRIAICLDRSSSLIVWLLAILKAGAAYVPLDPTYPAERLAFILEDAGAKVLVTDSRLGSTLPSGERQVIHVDVEPGGIGWSADNSQPVAGADHLAYVIYTSGSTGRPKGVAVEHRSAVNLVCWALETFTRDELAGVLASTSVSFDVSVFELFVTLSAGGTVILVENVLALSHGTGAGVTFVSTVPSAAVELLRSGAFQSTIKVVALAGEHLPRDLADRLCEHVGKVVDMYGPTEAAVYSTYVVRRPGDRATIGRPIANSRTLVLDRFRQPVPIGLPGELYLGGAGLARGYLGRPDLTADRFVPDPLSDIPGERLYRTGDSARWLPDGTLEFLGRLDHQVKLRGFRIELGEIESILREHSSVREVMVVQRKEAPEDVRLVAYVVGDEPASPGQLRDWLGQRLPTFMIPSAFVHLDELPRLPNGKLDRALLERRSAEPPKPAGSESVPSTTVEKELAALWCDLLHIPAIGVDEDFFLLGGDSLLSVRLFAEIEKRFGAKLPLSSLFQNGTIRNQARFLARGLAAEAWTPIVPLKPGGTRAPFFLVHGIGGEVLGFEALARHLGPEQPVFGVQADTRRGPGFFTTVEDLAATYLRAMRAQAPAGPYRLGGYSSGGVIAYEVAQQLRAAGEEVSALVMLDSDAPGDPHAGWRVSDALRVLVNAAYWCVDDEFFSLSRQDQWTRVASKLRALRGRLVRAAGAGNGTVKVDIRDQLGLWKMPRESSASLEAHFNMIDAYRPRPYPGRVTVLRARTYGLISSSRPDLGWQPLALGGVTVTRVPGDHDSILREPRVLILAAALDRALK